VPVSRLGAAKKAAKVKKEQGAAPVQPVKGATSEDWEPVREMSTPLSKIWKD
jgi:hypothetical protein